MRPQFIPRCKHSPPRLYQNQSVNAVEGKSRCLFLDPYKTQTKCEDHEECSNVKPGGT
jgi:hypothetical protein